MARRHLHWVLAAVCLPVISLPFEWLAAYANRRFSQTEPGHRRWARGLLGLAVIDTILAILIVALVGWGPWRFASLTDPPRASRSVDPVRIGVRIVPNPDRPEEVRIENVGDDSPAARAGLQPGDVVVAVDGTPIRNVEQSAAAIASGTPGTPRTLRIRRNGQEADVIVIPERRPPSRDPAAELFKAVPTQSCLAGSMTSATLLSRWWGLWSAVVLMGLLWLLGRRSWPRQPRLWLWVVAALGSVLVTIPLTSFAVCLAVGGRSVGGGLVAELAESIGVLTISLVAMRHMAKRGLLGTDLTPRLGALHAVAFGAFYMFAINLRLRIVGAAIEAFAHVQLPPAAVEREVAGELGILAWPGVLLLVLTIAVVGPVEEEVLFRGVILPRLAPWMGAWRAIAATALIFSVLHEGFGTGPFGWRAASVFVIAVVLGWARMRTGGLAAPIALHMINNALSLLAPR